jgi:PAS domain S-box-containing protein
VALFAVGYFLASKLTEGFFGAVEFPSPFWLPDSVLLCALLLSPRKNWWLYLAAMWPLRIAAGAPAGTPFWVMLSGIGNDFGEALLDALLLQRILRRPVRLATLREWMVFLGIAVALVPAVSAAVAGPARHSMGDSWWGGTYRWFLGDSLAHAVATPALLYWLTGSYRRLSSRWKEFVAVAAGLLAVLYYAFFSNHAVFSPVLLYLPFPLLLWAAVRLRPVGTASAIWLVTLAAILSALTGQKNFAGNTPEQSILAIQLFLLLISISLLSLSILITERESKLQELETLLDVAPLPILIANDRACTDIRANRAGYDFFGMPRGSNVSVCASPEFRVVHANAGVRPDELPMQRAAANGVPVMQYSVAILRGDGKVLHTLGNAIPLLGEDGKPRGAVSAFLDITELKQAEDALRESEARFRLVADSAPVLIWVAGPDKLCTFFNTGWLEFTGRPFEEQVGDGWLMSVHPDDVERCLREYSEAFDARNQFKLEYRLRRFDGEYRWVVDHGVPRFDSHGAFCGYIGTAHDVTDRKLAEHSMQELSGQLIRAQEQERARIARELHDDLAQRMAMLRMGVDGLQQRLNGNPAEARKELAAISDMASDICSQIRNLSHMLHPSVLTIVGLPDALADLCREFASQHHLKVNFSNEEIPHGISEDVRLCVFRIVQEALRNVAKHSGVDEALVDLRIEGDDLLVCICDNGAGFQPESIRVQHGLGLISMRERLRAVAGRLTVQSAPSRGTRISVSIPLNPPGQGP